ncbi:hypothetical protein E2320_014029 [Naja naja]|nr:hypothetical protein E2320_014029 [Naja naja]
MAITSQRCPLFFHSSTFKMCEEMSHLLRNIRSIICIFEKYAKDDGDCDTLSKGELKQLIQTEFADVIVVSAENLGQKGEGDQGGLSTRMVENWKHRVGRDKIWAVDRAKPWLDTINPHDPKTIETVLHLLDTDCDGKVGFEEFTVLVFKVVKACYKKVQECQGTAGRPSKRDNTSIQQRDTPHQQVSKDGPSKGDITSTQQQEIPPQQISRDGQSQQDITSIQQQEIPPQQISRSEPSQRDITSTQQRDIPPQQVSRDGPYQRDTSSTQQREIPPQQISRDGQSQRDITSIQQQEIPPQQISRSEPSQRDITSTQQRDIPPQQVSRDGPSKRDTSSTQQQDIPPQQVSRDGPYQRDTSSTQQRDIPPQQVSRDGPYQRDTSSTQQQDIPPQQVSRDGPYQRDTSSTQQQDIPPQQVSRDGPYQRDTSSTQQRDIPPQQISRDGPSQRDTSSTQQRETQTSQVSPRPCQKLVSPKKILDAEELPQEQQRERTSLVTSYDEKEQSQQEEASIRPRTQTSRVLSVQRTIEDMIRGNLTCQTSLAEMRTEQAPAQGHPNALPPRRRCLQEPLSPDQEASQDVLQSVPQQSSQQRQVEERSSIGQEEVTSQTSGQDRRSQQSAVEMEQISSGEPLQETHQRSSGGRNQQVQVEERSASGHLRIPQVVQICDQQSSSVTLRQHQNDQQRCQSQGVEHCSVVQEDQEVQATGQVISRRQEPQMPVYRPHQEKERHPTTLERQGGPSEQRAASQEVTRPQVAERYPHGKPGELTIVHFSQDSSPRRPFQPSQFQLKQRPLQFPPPWSTKQ